MRALLRRPWLPARLPAASKGRRGCRVAQEALFTTDVEFGSFALDSRLLTALEENSFRHASPIQAKGIKPLLEGKDVVLAAETGSGKTLAYLLPLLTRILNEKRNLRLSHEPTNPDALAPLLQKQSHRYAWVLCPSVDLCKQVQSVMASLLCHCDRSLITTEISPSGLSRYTARPDVLLATPGSLLTALKEMQKSITRPILDKVGYVVVDEADLLVTGSYRSQLDQLFQMLYLCEREVAVKHLAKELQISAENFLALPRELKRAGIREGVRGMIEAGYSDCSRDEPLPEGRPFWKRQFVLAGATISSLGTKNVRTEIQQLFPLADIITTSNLHKAASQLHYEWIQIEPHQRMEALLNVIQSDASFQSRSRGKILVFAKDTPTTGATANFLAQKGLECIAYHKKVGSFYRSANLERFRKEEGVVMVCTDGMSRGMDIEGVTHIVQADFAPSAVAFVHRIGRTGRAGKDGKVTSLCTDADKELAEAIRDCIEDEIPIEGAFSRNRSFRKKLRRYGRFIPRGSLPPPDVTSNECTA